MRTWPKLPEMGNKNAIRSRWLYEVDPIQLAIEHEAMWELLCLAFEEDSGLTVWNAEQFPWAAPLIAAIRAADEERLNQPEPNKYYDSRID